MNANESCRSGWGLRKTGLSRAWAIGGFLFPVVVAAIGFGTWFQDRQLALQAPEFLSYYPAENRWQTVAEVALIFFCEASLWGLWVHWLFPSEPKAWGHRLSGASCLAFVGAPLGLSLPFCLLLFLCFRSIPLYFLFRRYDFRPSPKFRQNCAALFLIFVSQFLLNDFGSPLAWRFPEKTLDKGESKYLVVSSLLYQGSYVGAKRFDFSELDASYWSGVSHNPTGFTSRVVGVCALLLDLPAIDVSTCHRLVMALFFFWGVFASFGFFLFVRDGLQFSFLTSILGGGALLFSNSCFGILYTRHFPAFVGVFLMIPSSLWLLRRAFRSGVLADNLLRAALSGALLSLNFYLLASHPDAVIHGFAFFLAYAVFLAVFTREMGGLSRRILLLSAAFAALALGAAAFCAPILESLWRKDAAFFGHREGMMQHTFRQGLWFLGFPIVRALGALLVISAMKAREIQARWRQQPDFIFFLGWFLFFFLLTVPGKDGWWIPWLERHLPGLYFINTFRISLYTCFSALIIGLYGIELTVTDEKGRCASDWVGVILLVTGVFAFPWASVRHWSVFETARSLPGKLIFRTLLPSLCLALLVVRFAGSYLSRLRKGLVGGVLVWIWVSQSVLYFQWPEEPTQPNPCTPYVSFQTWLALYRGLGFEEESSLRRIGKRLDAYRAAMKLSPRDPKMNSATLLKLADESARLIDDFELSRIACLFPSAAQIASHHYPDPVPYNNAALFGALGNRYQRVQNATGDVSNIGIGSGFFINNVLMTADTRFMTAYPPLNALYLMPGNYFDVSGRYTVPTSWDTTIDAIRNPLQRRVFNVAGIDAYLVKQSEWAKVANRDGLEALSVSAPPALDPPLVLIKENRSRGMAYLASSVNFESSSLVAPLFRLRRPSDRVDARDFATYRQTVDALWSRLLQPKSQDVTWIEDEQKTGRVQIADTKRNHLAIRAIAGNKAAFHVHCESEPCWLVLNLAALNGWRAYEENTPLVVHRANFAFLAAQVSRGDHFVWFEHRRFWADLGQWLTWVSYAMLLGFALIRTGNPSPK